jgi:hypothetical protein
MSDRELLELAAKAAGFELDWHGRDCCVAGYIELWNPLTDDGDEARLEAALRMHVQWMPAIEQVAVGTAEVVRIEKYGTDRQAARRRAGVRAAAAIGQAMP